MGYFASCFNRAIKGAGTNDDELISLVVCLKRNDDLKVSLIFFFFFFFLK